MTETVDPATLAAAFGHGYQPPEWPVTSDPPVPIEEFGKDHWSTFAYIEHCAVELRGKVNADKMRTDRGRHPILAATTRSELFGLGATSGEYPTRLRVGERTGHDDWDCADDLVAAGLLAVQMPQRSEDGDWFEDVLGQGDRDGSGRADQAVVSTPAWTSTTWPGTPAGG